MFVASSLFTRAMAQCARYNRDLYIQPDRPRPRIPNDESAESPIEQLRTDERAGELADGRGVDTPWGPLIVKETERRWCAWTVTGRPRRRPQQLQAQAMVVAKATRLYRNAWTGTVARVSARHHLPACAASLTDGI